MRLWITDVSLLGIPGERHAGMGHELPVQMPRDGHKRARPPAAAHRRRAPGAAFLSGACCWVLAEGSGPGLFHAGAIDAGSLAVMAVALVMAQRATGLARKAAPGARRR